MLWKLWLLSECERLGMRDRQTETDRLRERERETDRQTDRQTERQRDRDRETERQRQTERQTDRDRDRQTDRQTDRQSSNIELDCSFMSICTNLTASPCYTTNTNKHDYTANKSYKHE